MDTLTYDAQKKSMLVAYLIWFLVGSFGGHRFYLGRNNSAITMLVLSIIGFVTLLVLIGLVILTVTAIWAIVDAFLIPGMTEKYNLELAKKYGYTAIPAPVSQNSESTQ